MDSALDRCSTICCIHLTLSWRLLFQDQHASLTRLLRQNSVGSNQIELSWVFGVEELRSTPEYSWWHYGNRLDPSTFSHVGCVELVTEFNFLLCQVCVMASIFNLNQQQTDIEIQGRCGEVSDLHSLD